MSAPSACTSVVGNGALMRTTLKMVDDKSLALSTSVNKLWKACATSDVVICERLKRDFPGNKLEEGEAPYPLYQQMSAEVRNMARGRCKMTRVWTMPESGGIGGGPPPRGALCIAVCPFTGNFITGGFDKVVRFWSPESRSIRATTGSPPLVLLSAAVSPESGDFVTACSGPNKTLHIWDGNHSLKKEPPLPPRENVLSMALSPLNQQIVIGYVSGTLHLLNQEGELIKTMKAPIQNSSLNHQIHSIAISRTGTIFTASVDGTLLVWDSKGDFVRTLYENSEDHPMQIACSPITDCTIATFRKKILQMWNPDGTLNCSMQREEEVPCPRLVVSPITGHIIAGSGNGNFYVWDKRGSFLSKIKGPGTYIHALAISPVTRQLLSSAQNGVLAIWDFSIPEGKQKSKQERKSS